jgi:hypothetical protein
MKQGLGGIIIPASHDYTMQKVAHDAPPPF